MWHIDMQISNMHWTAKVIHVHIATQNKISTIYLIR